MANLNFTYNWQNQKNIAGKNNMTQIVSSNARPLTNGYWDNSQSGNLDGNSFIPRPIKAWRKQLQPNPIRGGTKSKNIIIENEQPSRIITPNDKCCNTTNNITTQIVSNLSSDKSSSQVLQLRKTGISGFSLTTRDGLFLNCSIVI